MWYRRTFSTFFSSFSSPTSVFIFSINITLISFDFSNASCVEQRRGDGESSLWFPRNAFCWTWTRRKSSWAKREFSNGKRTFSRGCRDKVLRERSSCDLSSALDGKSPLDYRLQCRSARTGKKKRWEIRERRNKKIDLKVFRKAFDVASFLEEFIGEQSATHLNGHQIVFLLLGHFRRGHVEPILSFVFTSFDLALAFSLALMNIVGRHFAFLHEFLVDHRLRNRLTGGQRTDDVRRTFVLQFLRVLKEPEGNRRSGKESSRSTDHVENVVSLNRHSGIDRSKRRHLK